MSIQSTLLDRLDGVEHRSGDRRGGGDRARLAHALDAEGVHRRRGLGAVGVEARQLGRRGQRVVHERARDQLALVVVDHLLVERLADRVRDAAVHLALDEHRVDGRPAVVDRVVVDHLAPSRSPCPRPRCTRARRTGTRSSRGRRTRSPRGRARCRPEAPAAGCAPRRRSRPSSSTCRASPSREKLPSASSMSSGAASSSAAHTFLAFSCTFSAARAIASPPTDSEREPYVPQPNGPVDGVAVDHVAPARDRCPGGRPRSARTRCPGPGRAARRRSTPWPSPTGARAPSPTPRTPPAGPRPAGPPRATAQGRRPRPRWRSPRRGGCPSPAAAACSAPEGVQVEVLAAACPASRGSRPSRRRCPAGVS